VWETLTPARREEEPRAGDGAQPAKIRR
jgi:hypothetical protein